MYAFIIHKIIRIIYEFDNFIVFQVDGDASRLQQKWYESVDLQIWWVDEVDKVTFYIYLWMKYVQ